MAKKLLALLLALVLVIGLVACANTNTPSQPDATKDDASATDGASANDDVPAEDLEYVKLKFIAVGDPTADEERIVEEINKLMLEDINAELEVEWLSWSDYDTKYPLIFTGGEEFDMIFAARWAGYSSHAQKGAFYELTEEDLQKYMPNTWANVTKDQWADATVDGKIYMLPMSAPGYYQDYLCTLLRGDIIKEAGLQSVETPEDLYTYFDYIVANHPEIIPIDVNTFNNGANATRLVLGRFSDSPYDPWANKGYYTPFTGCVSQDALGPIPMIIDYTDPANVKLVDQETVDEYYINLFKKCKELQEKGYWSADALTRVDQDSVAFANGQGGAMIGSLFQTETALTGVMGEHPEWEPVIVKVSNDPFKAMKAHSNGMAINANTKNLERTMMALDLLGYDSRYYDLMYYGIEGEHYNLTEDGKVESISSFAGASINMGFVTTSERIVSTASDGYVELKNWGASNVASYLPETFTFDASSLETERAAMSQLYSRYFPLLALGMAEDVEATYYEYLEQAEAAGAFTIRDEFMKQFEEHLAKNN